MSVISSFALFSLMVFVSIILDVAVTKLHFRLTKSHYKEHHFKFGKYVLFIFFPLIAVLTISYITSWSLLTVFAVSAIIGSLGEGFIGWGYNKVIGQRLWTYHRYSINKYTSFLSLPFWGIAGIFFWLLARLFV